MNIRHRPLFDTGKVADLYSQKDGVPVRYVCTTDLSMSDVPADVFYRDTPHPEFGNHYFGLYWHPDSGNLMVTNADHVEDMTFGCVENDQGELEYSASHHDFKQFSNGNMIDGGRQYIRGSGRIVTYKVQHGEFHESQD